MIHHSIKARQRGKMHGLPMAVGFAAQGPLLWIKTRSWYFKFGIDSEFKSIHSL